MSKDLEKRLLGALASRAEQETLTSIASSSGVSQPQLHRFLNGQRSLTLGSASKLADYLGLELNPRSEGGNGAGPAKRPARKKKSP